MAATINPSTKKNCSDSRFLIKVLWVGNAAGVNGPVIFLTNGTKVHQRLRGNKLVTKYGFPVGSFVVLNKAAYIYDKTWAKVVEGVTPGIRNMKVRNVGFVCSTLFYTYLTLNICTSKFYADD